MSDAAPAALGLAGRLARRFQDHALTPLLALVALLLGLFAVLVTPREEEPQINVTMANVLIAFPGASSADVQAMVARPAEAALGQIAGIEHTYSVARPGMAVLTVQFKVCVPRTEALVRLYDVLNANRDWLPAGLGTLTPIVKPKGIDDVPLLAVTLWAPDGRSAADLARVAHTLEAELKRVPGSREVATLGGPGRVVGVALNPARLRERGVDVLRLKATLAAASQGLPAGAVLERIAQRYGAKLKLVEVPPGPPVLSPLVAEVYGPDEAGRQRLAAQVAQAFAATPDIVAIDSSLAADAPRAFLRVNRPRAEGLGIPVAVVAQTVAAALSGTDAGWLHEGQAKYPVAVRLQLPREAQVGLDALLAMPLRSASGALLPLGELVRVERGVIDKPLFTKDLHGVSYVFGDMAGPLDSPLYGLFAVRSKLAALGADEYWVHPPSDPFRAYAIKWDGESQITYDTFRDMSAAYGVGLILI